MLAHPLLPQADALMLIMMAMWLLHKLDARSLRETAMIILLQAELQSIRVRLRYAATLLTRTAAAGTSSLNGTAICGVIASAIKKRALADMLT